MAVSIISYPPGAGGNHLKNLCWLDGRFDDQWPWPWIDQQWVGTQVYEQPIGPVGTVHSLKGRNIHEVFIDQITRHPGRDYILHGHFGELAPHADRIRTWSDVNWLVLTMDQPADRAILRERQRRLQHHPYWLDEEQIYLYRPYMYHHYFGAQSVTTLSLMDFWAADLGASGVIPAIEQAFDLNIPLGPAQALHTKWRELNCETRSSDTGNML